MTLGGHVVAEGDKSQAESIAKSLAGAQVVSNQIEVIPPGAERDAEKVNADLDKGVERVLTFSEYRPAHASGAPTAGDRAIP